MKKYVNKCLIELVQGDITEQKTEAIVNAANEQLILGSGVAGAIRIKGGPTIQKQCDKLAPIKTGQAALTSAGNLKAKYVIHAVGPIQGQDADDQLLVSATVSALKIADGSGIKSISFPAISTGVFGFDITRCAQLMLNTVQDYIKKGSNIERIIFCLFDSHSFEVFAKQLLNDKIS